VLTLERVGWLFDAVADVLNICGNLAGRALVG
jgi:hypothetical protein